MLSLLARRTGIILGGLAAFNLAISIFVQWKVFVTLGPGLETDAYYAAQALPTVLITIFGMAVARVLVPLLIEVADSEKASSIWLTLLLSSAIFGALAFLLYSFSPFLISTLFPGFSEEERALPIKLLKVLSFSLLFGGTTSVLASCHQADHRFISTEFRSAFSALCLLAGVLWGLPLYGISAIAWAIVARYSLQTLLLFIGLPWPTAKKIPKSLIRKLWRRLKPLLLGSSIYKTGPIVDRYLASLAPTGSIAILTFAQQLYSIGLAIVDKALGSPFVAKAATLIKQKKFIALRRKYKQYWFYSIAASILLWIGFIAVGHLVLDLIVGYGVVKPADLDMLWNVMAVLGGFLTAGVAGQLSAAGLYAFGETAMVSRIAILSFFTSVAAKIAGFYYLGIYGIAVGIVCYQLLNAIALHYRLLKLIKSRLI